MCVINLNNLVGTIFIHTFQQCFENVLVLQKSFVEVRTKYLQFPPLQINMSALYRKTTNVKCYEAPCYLHQTISQDGS
jgi:hypothetical protein